MSEAKKTGVISLKDLEKCGLLPPEERLKKGPVAILECIERIPCDICVDGCPVGAISMKSIIDLPQVDFDKCTGCGNCVLICPGLAAFVVDLSPPDKALVTIPHEMLPEPEVGKMAILLTREGKEVGKGKIVRVVERNKTYAVTVEVPKEYAMEVRAVRVVA